ncbi:ABC-three component system middle component 2 [Bifidobacterium longum]|uniref:ABC-three component system middle component 2 n=2 Tax=Bifidobacterium longum TaxID=216816 RepID=UPI0034A08F22
MNNSLFNTTQETATRLTLCLPLLSRPSTIDEIAAIDLTATYMKAFGFGQHNLHGDGPHALAEYDARRKRVQAGLAQLVIIGAATVDSTCLFYRATPECLQYSEALHGDYATSYRRAVQLLIKNEAFRCLVWVSGSGGGGAGRVVWGYGYHVVVHRRPATA